MRHIAAASELDTSYKQWCVLSCVAISLLDSSFFDNYNVVRPLVVLDSHCITLWLTRKSAVRKHSCVKYVVTLELILFSLTQILVRFPLLKDQNPDYPLNKITQPYLRLML